MKRWEAWTVHLSMLLVTVTGLVYAWMRYLLPPLDPYSPIHHPLQPATQHAHVLVAPLLVFACGLIWRDHVWRHFQRGVKVRRASGLLLLLGLVPMVVSGYLLQTTVGEGWRTAWLAVHLSTSGLFTLGYGGHLVGVVQAWARRRARGQRRAAAESPLDGVTTAG